MVTWACNPGPKEAEMGFLTALPCQTGKLQTSTKTCLKKARETAPEERQLSTDMHTHACAYACMDLCACTHTNTQRNLTLSNLCFTRGSVPRSHQVNPIVSAS